MRWEVVPGLFSHGAICRHCVKEAVPLRIPLAASRCSVRRLATMGERIRQIFLLPVNRPRGRCNRRICTSATELYSGSSDEWPGAGWLAAAGLEDNAGRVAEAGPGVTGSNGTIRFFVTEQPVRTTKNRRSGTASAMIGRNPTDDQAGCLSPGLATGGRGDIATALFIDRHDRRPWQLRQYVGDRYNGKNQFDGDFAGGWHLRLCAPGQGT